ncbi:MAG: tetratricopeptide repeat protein, partial [Bacteroidales bacterium]|nr:tetratricopeptide repeat protein [Bacteroidales bacterium]
ESFKFSLAINPESAATYFNLGNAYFQISEYAKAIDAYQNSMKYEDNKQYVTLNYIGECYMMMEEYDDAVSFFNRSLEINDNYDEGYCSMAKAFNKQEKNIEALVCIDKAISINGKEPDFFSVKGNVLFDLDRFDETEVCLLKALELNPEDIDLRIGVVGFYLFMNEPDKGINFLIEYVNNSDVEDIVLCLYSICNFYAGNKQEAYKYLSKALAANPDVISWINDNENYSDFTADPGINELLH